MRPATEHRGPRHFCLFFVSKYARCRNDPFRPFPKLHGVVMSHFCRFQNRLGLATLIFAIFKIILASRQPFGPFSKSFGLGDNHYGQFKIYLGVAIYAFGRFQNQLDLAIVNLTPTICRFVCRSVTAICLQIISRCEKKNEACNGLGFLVSCVPLVFWKIFIECINECIYITLIPTSL